MQAPNENVAQYELGEALDRLVATKLNLPYVVATGGMQHKMRYSRDIADAWLVVQKMLNLGYSASVGANAGGGCSALFSKGAVFRPTFRSHRSAPEAISKEALAVLEGET